MLRYYTNGCEKPFLPEDIIRHDILTRLPVKSLKRFQCVCKSWKSFIFDRAFTKSHMAARINLIHPEDDAMIARCHSHNCRVANNKSEHSVILSGSVNGLVCMYTYSWSSRTIPMIGIWNPFTRMYKDVLPPSNAASIEISNFFLTLGFDHIKNDYKVIFVSRDVKYRPLVADVYSCNAGSWCKINVSSSFVSRCPSISGLGHEKILIHVNGSIYWKSYDHKYVQTFDIIDEVFRVFPGGLDDQDDDFPNKRMILVNLRNSLAQIVHNTRCKETYVDVYVLINNQTMDCGSGSSTWIKLYRVGPILLPLLMTSMGCFSITGNLVFNDQYNLKLLCIDEEKQAILKIKTISSDPSLYSFNKYVSYGFGYRRTFAFVRGMKPNNRLEFADILIIGSKGDIEFPSLIN